MIVSTPGICGGNPRVDHTRIPVWIIASLVWDGMPIDTLIENYPPLTREDVDDALAYAAGHRQDILDEIQQQRIA